MNFLSSFQTETEIANKMSRESKHWPSTSLIFRTSDLSKCKDIEKKKYIQSVNYNLVNQNSAQ